MSSFRCGLRKREDLWFTNKLERRHTDRFYLYFRFFSFALVFSISPIPIYLIPFCFSFHIGSSNHQQNKKGVKNRLILDSASSEQKKRIHCMLWSNKKKYQIALILLKAKWRIYLLSLYKNAHNSQLALTLTKTTITIKLPIHSAMCHLYCNVTNADILDVRS